MNTNLFYTNKKGERIDVGLTRHAIARFIDRYQNLYGIRLENEEAVKQIAGLFRISKRVKRRGRKATISRRDNRYDTVSLYFVTQTFRFVVTEKAIVTIELSEAKHRDLNKNVNNFTKNSVA